MPATATVVHDMNCPRRAAPHSDPAKRVADSVNLHLTAGGYDAIGRFMAVQFADGCGDGVLYDSRRDAVLHQKHNEAYYVFVRIAPSNMTPCEAESLLITQRALYERGMRLNDRDHRAGGRVVIPRLTCEDQMAQLRQIVFGTRPTNLVFPS